STVASAAAPARFGWPLPSSRQPLSEAAATPHPGVEQAVLPCCSIQSSPPCLPKFCPINSPRQFLYSLMVITAHRGDSHINWSFFFSVPASDGCVKTA
ncbi:hypothetical protein LEMLEM_LOCUS16050, partial [Lemmus lemmus]